VPASFAWRGGSVVYNRRIDEPMFTFGLPPSLGQQPAWNLAREFADVLFRARFGSVIPFPTYDALEEALVSGKVDAAWGPPLICARIETAGGLVALRGVRAGAVTYRSALLCRARDQFDLATIGDGGFRPRAVWVSAWSMAGFVLPKAHLRGAGIDCKSMLLSEQMLGSYTACMDALLTWDADLTASFVGKQGLDAIWGAERMRRFRTLAFTDETPNDAVVLAANLAPERVAELTKNLDALLANERSQKLLAAAFSVDGFERPPANTYSPLLALREPLSS